jgi:hypothetical protein
MRQIQFCAWLWISTLAVSACSGGEFSTGEAGTSSGAAPGAGSAAQSPDPEGEAGSRGGSRGLSLGGADVEVPPAGAGGAVLLGGAPGSGGTKAEPPTTGGGKTEDCGLGGVRIRMLPDPKLAKDLFCDASCGTGWLTITDAEGATAFSISAACGTASCDTCEVQTCGAAACSPAALTAAGSELTWTGTYLAKDTCGDHVACQQQACVKPGKYKARACAALNEGESEYGCLPQERQVCAEAEFEFPSSEDVVLVLEQ